MKEPKKDHAQQPWPHDGCCEGCRTMRVCNVCSIPLTSSRCTNGRCPSCHGKFCTAGGCTSPGHGLNMDAVRAAAAQGGDA